MSGTQDWRIDRRRRDRVELKTEKITDLAAGDRERIALLEKLVKELQDQMALQPDNDAVAVPAAFGDLVVRVAQLAELVDNLEAGHNQISLQVEENPATELATEFSDFVATAMKMLSTLRMELDIIKRRVNTIDNEQAELISGMRSVTRQASA